MQLSVTSACSVVLRDQILFGSKISTAMLCHLLVSSYSLQQQKMCNLVLLRKHSQILAKSCDNLHQKHSFQFCVGGMDFMWITGITQVISTDRVINWLRLMYPLLYKTVSVLICF